MAEFAVVGEHRPSNRDLDGFAATLSGILDRPVIRANSLDELPTVPPACLLLSTGISARADLEALKSRFGTAFLERSIPIGVSSHGAELAIQEWGVLAAIDFWGFACWSVSRRSDNGATGLIVRGVTAEQLSFSARFRYAGLIEVADTEDLAAQTAKVMRLILDSLAAP
ncbi:MAG: hypothetical protein WD711_11960 [Dongiaceae bacterium]